MPDYTVCAGVREKRPLVHCISNIVTANDCANLLLACGASPMMAEAPEEMEEITRIADATVLNLGTPSREKYAAARICLEQSKLSGKPVVLDPVGVGAGEWRLKNAASLLSAAPPDIVRVNLAEAEALLGLGGSEQRVRAARTLAAKLGCAVLLTGAKDVVSDGERTAAISGGSGLMPLVTGSGCMLSALCGAFAAVERDAFKAACAASLYWKRCSELAGELSGNRGSGSFRAALMDAACRVTDDMLASGAQPEAL